MNFARMNITPVMVILCISCHVYGRPTYQKVFRRSTENSDRLNPTRLHNNQMFNTQNQIFPVAFYLPPWLMYFSEIWNMIIAKQQDLRVKFPAEFEGENDNNEAPEWNNQQENDDVTSGFGEAMPSWGLSLDDPNEIPETTESQNEFESHETAFETPEHELSPSGVTHLWDSNEADNTEIDNNLLGTDNLHEISETPEIKHNEEMKHERFDRPEQSVGLMSSMMNPTILNQPEQHEHPHNIGDFPMQSDDPTEIGGGMSHLNRPSGGLVPVDEHDISLEAFHQPVILNNVFHHTQTLPQHTAGQQGRETGTLNFDSNFSSSSFDSSSFDSGSTSTHDNESDSSS